MQHLVPARGSNAFDAQRLLCGVMQPASLSGALHNLDCRGAHQYDLHIKCSICETYTTVWDFFRAVYHYDERPCRRALLSDEIL